MKTPVNVGLVGSQFISAIHAGALQHCAQARLDAVASSSPSDADSLAKRFGIPNAFRDYRELLARSEIQMVVGGVPNHLCCLRIRPHRTQCRYPFSDHGRATHRSVETCAATTPKTP